MAKESAKTEPVEVRLAAVSKGLESAAADLKALVAQMLNVLEEPEDKAEEEGK